MERKDGRESAFNTNRKFLQLCYLVDVSNINIIFSCVITFWVYLNPIKVIFFLVNINALHLNSFCCILSNFIGPGHNKYSYIARACAPKDLSWQHALLCCHQFHYFHLVHSFLESWDCPPLENGDGLSNSALSGWCYCAESYHQSSAGYLPTRIN